MNLQSLRNSETNLPKVIFLDAMGTLFGLKGTVGEVYGKIAEEFGVRVDYPSLNQAFFASFQETSSLAFPNCSLNDIPTLEKQWWLNVAKASFHKIDQLTQFNDFSAFFERLYLYFASQDPWFVYSDVIPTLEDWQQQGVILGIISNFDSRLFQVLESLKLDHFFSSITLSSIAGYAKPNGKIFEIALAKHQCLPSQVWHIGDHQKDDYEGAKQLGIKAFLVDHQRQ